MKNLSPIPLLPCLLFSIPFLILAVNYRALPAELVVLRTSLHHGALFAPKSIFMIFRVPTANLIHGLMAAVMLTRAPDFPNAERRHAYASMFSTLLFAIALKSNFEAAEFCASASPLLLQPYGRWLGVGTLLSVAIGIGLALWRGRKVPLPWRELRLSTQNKLVLSSLFALWFAIVAFSVSGAHETF